jgi:hypothetical protein
MTNKARREIPAKIRFFFLSYLSVRPLSLGAAAACASRRLVRVRRHHAVDGRYLGGERYPRCAPHIPAHPGTTRSAARLPPLPTPPPPPPPAPVSGGRRVNLGRRRRAPEPAPVRRRPQRVRRGLRLERLGRRRRRAPEAAQQTLARRPDGRIRRRRGRGRLSTGEERTQRHSPPLHFPWPTAAAVAGHSALVRLVRFCFSVAGRWRLWEEERSRGRESRSPVLVYKTHALVVSDHPIRAVGLGPRLDSDKWVSAKKRRTRHVGYYSIILRNKHMDN